nr:hypothetical protein [Tanacetum cinerariifolium]
MSTQQDIYAAGSESRPPMLNKENYVPWSSLLLQYAKSRPNEKLIHNFIINGPYVRQMIPEPGDPNREVPVNETFHVQTDDELTENELKQIEADDQAIQTILLGLPKDVYAVVDSCELLKKFEVDDLKVEQLARTQDPLALMATSNNSYTFPVLHQDQPSFNQNYMQQPMPNLKDITDLITTMNMALALMAKAFKLNYSTPINNNQRISSNLRNKQIAQPRMNMGQDRHMRMVGEDFIKPKEQADCSTGYEYGSRQTNVAQNPRVQNDGIQNQIRNGNLVAVRAEGNAAGHNGNQIRCYNCRGVGHFARDCTVRPRRRDAAYLQTQLLIAQKEEVGIQLQAEEYDLMVAAVDLDEIEEVNANCILMANLQKASSSDPTTAMNMALALMAKAFKLNYSTPTNNNQRISSNPRNRQIAQPGISMGQDRQMQMIRGNVRNQFRQYAGQNAGNLNGYNAVQNVKNQVAQNPRVQNDGIQNQIGNGNLVAVRAEGNAAGHNGNQIRCYNCRGVGHFSRDCTVKPKRRDAAYLQT